MPPRKQLKKSEPIKVERKVVAAPAIIKVAKKTSPAQVKADEAVHKAFKDSGFSRVGDAKDRIHEVLRTGIFGLDHDIFGTGGFVRGTIAETFGAVSGGKSTLMTQVIAATQEDDPEAEIALVDAEHSLDPTYAGKLGADMDRLLWSQPTVGEEALQSVIDIVTTGRVKLVIVDSVAALVPKAELEGEMTDAHMGLQARMMGQAMRKMTGIVNKTRTVVVFINQVRVKMGASAGFGDNSDTPGGKALKYFASSRTQIDRIKQITVGPENNKTNVGNVTQIKNVKNKGAAPLRKANFDMMFDLPLFPNNKPGFSHLASLADYAIEHGVWKKTGTQYVLASTGEVVNGRNNLVTALGDDPMVREITERATLMAMNKSAAYIKARLG